MASITGKRPLDSNNEDSDAKRLRANDGSPARPNGTSEDDKKEELRMRMAAMKAKLAAQKAGAGAQISNGQSSQPSVAAAMPSASSPGKNSTSVEAKKAEAQRKIAEMKAKMAAKKAGQVSTSTQASSTQNGERTSQPSEKDARIAEARIRVAEKTAEVNRRLAESQPSKGLPRDDGGDAARGGLGIGLHPSLMGDKPTAAKSSTIKGSKSTVTQDKRPREESGYNRYLMQAEESDKMIPEDIYDPNLNSKKGAERKSKALVFNQKGKFMAQANALRQQARVEEMKERIAAQSRKAAIEEASDKSFLIAVPPEVEWWDEGIIGKIDTPDTIVTALVQHPIVMQPPQDKFQPASKPLMLTQKEQAKLRRMRRTADQKEEQAKIRLGLKEPPPPKVKKSNMMRVFGEQAVQDPTAVEARVNREIAQRAMDHEKANADRALTDEQRREKLKRQQEGDESKGVQVAVFRIDNLSCGKHRFQIDQNAKQHALTGMVVIHPEMNLVIVEGGRHSMTKYKKLMLNRIQWTENVLPLANTNRSSTFTGAGGDGTKTSGGGQSKASEWLSSVDENGDLKDLSANRCQLVWEGEEAQRSFKRWGSKACETDGEARNVLSRNKMENMWTRARSMN